MTKYYRWIVALLCADSPASSFSRASRACWRDAPRIGEGRLAPRGGRNRLAASLYAKMRIAEPPAGGLTASDRERRRNGVSTGLFDTMEATGALTRAGLAESQARAIVATVRKAVSGGVATGAEHRRAQGRDWRGQGGIADPHVADGPHTRGRSRGGRARVRRRLGFAPPFRRRSRETLAPTPWNGSRRRAA